MSDRPYRDCCQAGLAIPESPDMEGKLNHLIMSIVREDPEKILKRLYNIYSKLPTIDEGLHQLERIGLYDEELQQIGLLHENLARIIAERAPFIPIETQIGLWRCIRWNYERIRMLEPKM